MLGYLLPVDGDSLRSSWDSESETTDPFSVINDGGDRVFRDPAFVEEPKKVETKLDSMSINECRFRINGDG